MSLDQERVLVPLSGPGLPASLVRNDVTATLKTTGPTAGLEVRFSKVAWPNAMFRPSAGSWDWRGYSGIAVDLYNPEAEAVSVAMRVDNAGADGVAHCNQLGGSAAPRAWSTLRLRFNRGGDARLWGMRGLPITGPTGGSAVLDLSQVTAFQVFLPMPSREHTLVLRNMRLVDGGSTTDPKVTFPFVDRFGQYRGADWPGKLKGASELVARLKAEKAAAAAGPRDRDEYGGWTGGPTMKATGWFRTEKVDGRWWLVTPTGHPFFSNGVDCVGPGEYTFVDGRDGWFEWLPAPGDPLSACMDRNEGAHSMAEPIQGKGRTFSFYRANLMRKYGADWRAGWDAHTAARLKGWGFNTIGNWSDWDFMSRAKIPYTASGGVWGNVRRIEGGGGYWGKMVDAYDPGFAAAAEEGLKAVAQRFANDPYCIGYFADNEIAWEAVEKGPLASPPGQPCRIAQVAMLMAKYSNLESLNRAWGTSAASWDALRAPDAPNAACRADLDSFTYAFARRYFEGCRAAIRRYAPHQLYLGCRFASSLPAAVRACGDVADVVSFNRYEAAIDPAAYSGERDPGKPILVGEFHFGALDRGMFHEGLGPRANQAERAAAYIKYVRSVADCPNFVGCHWFQYVDEPITGRWFDGENYNIGLVDVTDTGYPELIAAARRVHGEVYSRHLAAGK